jgi:hypothetical protein
MNMKVVLANTAPSGLRAWGLIIALALVIVIGLRTWDSYKRRRYRERVEARAFRDAMNRISRPAVTTASGGSLSVVEDSSKGFTGTTRPATVAGKNFAQRQEDALKLLVKKPGLRTFQVANELGITGQRASDVLTHLKGRGMAWKDGHRWYAGRDREKGAA